ncbi:hypothetical protein [Atlantibacter hermannii]|uniref:hypothetical protein n=1 Tax=Atlantibacter hermannii TaxID=565 RepID=UPI0022B77EA6|nr:hypothetical protein [Atlantibacter hermannii]MCZ7837039.1 hypothetical protein [Atlantibacter hermannii]
MNLLAKFFITMLNVISYAHAYDDLPETIDMLVRPADENVGQYKIYVDEFFKKSKDADDDKLCDGHVSKLGYVYINKHPDNITPVLLLDAIDNKKSRDLLSERLASYVDENFSGFGAVIFYYLSGRDIIFYGMSTDPSVMVREEISVKNISDFRLLSDKLCKVIYKLPLIGQ